MERIYQAYKDVVAFRLIYIKEAHAADSDWPVPYATEQSINQPTTYGGRCVLAQKLVDEKQLTIPAIVESMANGVDEDYHAGSTRAFLVRKDGTLGVAGGRGPQGLSPAIQDIEKWLEEYKKTGKEPGLPEA